MIPGGGESGRTLKHINKKRNKFEMIINRRTVRGFCQEELNFLIHMGFLSKPIFTGAASCCVRPFPLSLGHQSRQCFCLAVYQYVSSPYPSPPPHFSVLFSSLFPNPISRSSPLSPSFVESFLSPNPPPISRITLDVIPQRALQCRWHFSRRSG